MYPNHNKQVEETKFFYIVVVGEGEMGQKGGKVLGEAQGDAI